MLTLCKFDFKNRLQNYVSFSINNKIIFVDSFKFLSSSLDNLVKNLGKDVFKYFSEELGSMVYDLVK